MGSQKAFTLVELLVVITILALLMAIMAPSAKVVMERTNMDICKSNLHHLGIANWSYINDNNFTFIPFRIWIVGDYRDRNSLTSSQSRIFKYIQNPSFFLCPTFKSTCAPDAVRSYVMHHSFGNWYNEGWPNGKWGNGFPIYNPMQVVDPARLGLCTEEATYAIPGCSRVAVNDAHLCCSGWPTQDSIAQFHYPGPGPMDTQMEGLGNVVFVDGHVGSVHTVQTPYVVCQTWYDKPDLARLAGL